MLTHSESIYPKIYNGGYIMKILIIFAFIICVPIAIADQNIEVKGFQLDSNKLDIKEKLKEFNFDCP
jgi:hypothetical protein